jgi:transposase
MIAKSNQQVNLYIGIDVSKETLDIALNETSLKIDNNRKSIQKFINLQLATTQIALVVESTGGYERLVIKVMQESSIAIHRAHPNRVHSFARACNHFAKTDKLDAILLSKYAKFVYEEYDVRGDQSIDEAQEKLHDLRSLTKAIEISLHGAQCRLKQYNSICAAILKKEIEFYKKQLHEINKQMGDIIAQSPALSSKSKIMQTMKGLGPKSAAALLAELPELGKLSKRKIACLTGVVPKTYESGKKIAVGHISGGRFDVRKTLYMCALVASRFCPILSKAYQELLTRNKAKKVALVALMRRIVVWLNAMVRDMKEFRACNAMACKRTNESL